MPDAELAVMAVEDRRRRIQLATHVIDTAQLWNEY
jgi:hypothetical protein